MCDDKDVMIYERELKFLRRIAETSSDLVKGRHWSEFCKACGGQDKLESDHEDAVNEFEEWLRSADGD